MKTIELVTPCYNEEKCIKPFYDEVKRVFEGLPNHEFIITYVDDGSKDHTLENIKKVVEEAPKGQVRYISFSRNFGKESAIYAGLSRAKGDYVCLLDVDLQHPPTLIPQMIDAIEVEGYDCATARRISRKGEPKVRSALSRAFYHVFNRITAIELAPGSTDFRLMKREVALAVTTLSETERFTKGIYSWVGFKNKWIEYANVERVNGVTKWSMRGLVRYSYSSFMAFATTPLRGVIWLGMLIVLVDVIWIIRMFVRSIQHPELLGSGFTTLMMVILFLGGMIITILGMIGEYLARIYMEVKKRPIYIMRESNIDEED